MQNSPVGKLSRNARAAWKEVVDLWHRYGFRDIAVDLLSKAPPGVKRANFKEDQERLAFEELEKRGLLRIEEVILDSESGIVAGWTFAVHPTELAIELVKKDEQ